MTNPLVSVGIPTYNRPELLKKRIHNVLSQSYQNLEIVVSDNASSNSTVREIIEQFVLIDGRVKFIQQVNNIGPSANFAVVLEESHGEFFVWAADDDIWDKNFIEVCLQNIGTAQLVVPNISMHYSATENVELLNRPAISRELSAYQNVLEFFKNTQPSMIYGLHRRSELLNYMRFADFRGGGGFDVSDVAIIYSAIVGKGLELCSGTKYSAGVEGEKYTPKVYGRYSSPGLISYRGLARSLLWSTFSSGVLTFGQKFILAWRSLVFVANLMVHLAVVHPEISRQHHLVISAVWNFPGKLRKKIRNLVG